MLKKAPFIRNSLSPSPSFSTCLSFSLSLSISLSSFLSLSLLPPSRSHLLSRGVMEVAETGMQAEKCTVQNMVCVTVKQELFEFSAGSIFPGKAVLKRIFRLP